MIAAVVLAAGLSKRMGEPKMVLPWGQTTVIGQVVAVLQQSGLEHICVVTGGAQTQVQAALQGLPVQFAFNPNHTVEEMTLSLQVGLAALPPQIEAALITLGDQPQIETQVVQSVLQAYRDRHPALVVPSFHPPGADHPRRGHPWLVVRALWPEILALQPPHTLRTFLTAQAAQITYLPVATDSILRDLDTPQDYKRQRPAEK